MAHEKGRLDFTIEEQEFPVTVFQRRPSAVWAYVETPGHIAIRLIRQEQQWQEQTAVDDAQWRKAIRQYADITELDPVTLNKLVRQIEVHEEIGGDGARKIGVEIHFNMRQPGKTE